MRCKEAQINQNLQFLHETQDLSPPFSQSHCVTRENTSRIPFEFIVPESLISPQSDVGSEYLSLLPTVKEGSLYVEPRTGRNFMQPLVSYTLTASLVPIRCGKILQVSREISIFPVVSVAPPLQIENFSLEYQMTCSQTARGKWWTGPIGRLTVSAAEPPPLNVSTRSPRATTKVSVKLLFTPTKAATSIAPPYEWLMTVKSYLQIMTFTTTKPFTQAPTQDRAKKTSVRNQTSKKTLPEIRQCDPGSWRLHRISETGTVIPDVQLNPWTSTLLVPVNTSLSLLPTFLCPLAARRYILVLQLSVAGLRHGRLCLRIPIQIINEPEQLVDTPTRNSLAQDVRYDADHVDEGVTSILLEDAGSSNAHALAKPPPYKRDQYMRRA